MPRTKKTTDVKATDKKTVKAAPAEEVKFAELVVEPDKKTENKSEVKNEAGVVPAKTEPKKAGRKPAAKKAASSVKEEKHDIVRLPDAITEGTKLVFDENGKTKVVNVSDKDTDKKAVKKAGRKPAANKAATPAKAKEEINAVEAPVKKETKKAAAKKAAPAKAAKIITTSVLQVAGSEFDFDKVVKAVEGLKKKNAGKSLEIYIKPEDNAIYYVVNGKGGKKIDI